MKKSKSWLIFTALAALAAVSTPRLLSHCEVPCGIYDDEMRFALIAEHITTIEKAMTQVLELSKQPPINMNQIVRWVVNKEKHAEEIQHIISQYFLTQRLKLVEKQDSKAEKKLFENLVLCHEVLVYAMKCKQTTDLENLEKLKDAVKSFNEAYFEGLLEPGGH